MEIRRWLEWLYPCTIMRKLSAMFEIDTLRDNLDAGIAGTYISLVAMLDIGEHRRQDLENCDEDGVEKKEAFESVSTTSEQERPTMNNKVEEEEEDYYEMVEPPDGQYFEAVNEIYAEIGGGYKRDLSSCASESSSEEGEDNAIVTAKPAIVMEDQIDSLSYVGYDDIAGSLPRGLSKGGLYEDIAGSLLNLARIKSGDDDLAKAAEGAAAGSDPDEMLSYTLAKLSEASNNNSSAADSGDKSSDEWVDLDDDEEETDDYDTAEQRLVRNKNLVR